MKEANPSVHVARLIGEKNYLAAQLYLKEAQVDPTERSELLGRLASAVVDELSRTRREDRERILYLRSVLAWVLREVPGLGSLYREQVRVASGGTDLLSELGRGVQGVRDVFSGRKSVADGVQDAAEDVRRNLEEAGERIRSGEGEEQVAEFLTAAERGLRDGLDQLTGFFRALNRDGPAAPGASTSGASSAGASPAGSVDPDDARAAARADRDRDVEDAEFGEAGSEADQPINVERE